MSSFQKTADAKLAQNSQSDLGAKLQIFKQHVMIELRQINQLFDEFTPHDEQHIISLLGVTDQVLGDKIIESLTISELFILSCSLYAHDWGMAVGVDEKAAILRGSSGLTSIIGPDGKPYYKALLSDEDSKFSKFCSEVSLSPGEIAREENKWAWRDYVRRTHHLRSAERVLHYFDQIGSPGIAVPVARICEAHGLDFEMLMDQRRFPLISRYEHDTYNMQALAVYLRIIDLLDICQDRTPYELWRYNNPRNKKSALEWKKHASLDPVIRDGDELVIRGEILEHETWLDFLELQEYCDDQYKLGRDLLAKNGAYRLPANFIKWDEIKTAGFEPIRMRFDFDRTRILELLSEEIYDSDPYVFLRELIQNAIDATEARRGLLKMVGLLPDVGGCIEVSVSSEDDGSQVVTVSDQGTGMSRLVIDRYLSVVGSSFYQSDDFLRLKLPFDPISRFGIGILSCFSVAEKLEIQTTTDPSLSDGFVESWYADISSEHSYWKVVSSRPSAPGTTVRVRISKKKLERFKSRESAAGGRMFGVGGSLRVSDYIRTIAGFVRIPIVVIENGIKDLILHPSNNFEEFGKRFIPNRVFVVSDKYTIVDAILPQDVGNASEVMRIETVDLKDLEISGIEGILSYLVPKDDALSFDWKGSSGQYYVTKPDGSELSTRFRQDTIFQQNIGDKLYKSGFSPSCQKDHFVSVYRDGLLVPDVEMASHMRNIDDYGRSPFGRPFLQLNIRGNSDISSLKLTASRLRFGKNEDSWAKIVFRAHTIRVSRKCSPEILKMEPMDRLRRLDSIFRYHYIVPRDFLEYYPIEEWPLPFLNSEGGVRIRLWKDVRDRSVIPELPELVAVESTFLLRETLHPQGNYTPRLREWKGDEALLKLSSSLHYGMSHLRILLSLPFEVEGWSKSERTVVPPYFPLPPLPQDCWNKKRKGSESKVKSSPASLDGSLLMARDRLTQVGRAEVSSVSNRLNAWIRFDYITCDEMPQAFERCCILPNGVVNVRNEIGKVLFQVYAVAVLALAEKRLSSSSKGKIEDWFSRLGRFFSSDWLSKKTFRLDDVNYHLSRLPDVLREAKLAVSSDISDLKLSFLDFFPGAFPQVGLNSNNLLPINLSGNVVNLADLPMEGMRVVESFGQGIIRTSAWPPT